MLVSTTKDPAATVAKRWWAIVTVAMLLPPVRLSFTGTMSGVSPALPLVMAYLVWWMMRLAFRPVKAPPGARISLLLSAYVFVHGTFVTWDAGAPLVFLMQAQWAVYLAAFALCAAAVTASEHSRGVAIRMVLVAALVEACLGFYTSAFGPLVDSGTWYGSRFGLSFYRATGTFVSANGLAGFLAVCAVIVCFAPKHYLPIGRGNMARWVVAGVLTCGVLQRSPRAASPLSAPGSWRFPAQERYAIAAPAPSSPSLSLRFVRCWRSFCRGSWLKR